ncbi:ABC transporter ATP-binding protein [Halosquirtibacter laminarini]|uniref:ABC transporter ATP-binding protein n=1 Tax=Halosquirtibacter laminarini TaxID=3374600 RepID=A0AC61NJ52_9BACT|nr:ABC transporter ATP-binding protein [Prolixibacteraceae bacterium]
MKLEILNATVGYVESGDKKKVKSAISLEAEQGDIIALLGSNGVGKSTLLRTIVGIQPLLEGEVRYNNYLIDAYSKQDWSTKVSYVSTDRIMAPNMSVYDIVSLGRFPYTGWMGRLRKEDVVMVEQSMKQVGVWNFRDREISTLSDGEKQRVMIARALAQDTEILILDEPTAFLDLPNKYEIIYLLKSLARKMHKIVIFSTHDFNIATHEVDKLWLVTSELCVQGAPEDLMKTKDIDSLFKSDKIVFDIEQGDFVSVHDSSLFVSVQNNTNNKEAYLLVTQALKRCHIGITNDLNDIVLTIRDEGYCLKFIDHETYHENIYSLCRCIWTLKDA